MTWSAVNYMSTETLQCVIKQHNSQAAEDPVESPALYYYHLHRLQHNIIIVSEITASCKETLCKCGILEKICLQIPWSLFTRNDDNLTSKCIKVKDTLWVATGN